MNNLLNDNEQNLRQDIYSFLRLFNVIIHFELKNFEFLEYLIKSTNRYLNKQTRTFEAESICINYMKKIAKTNSDSNVLFIELKRDLSKVLINQNESVLLEYFNLIAWVDSKINKTTFNHEVKLHSGTVIQ